jgi:hypothetical protein
LRRETSDAHRLEVNDTRHRSVQRSIHLPWGPIGGSRSCS